jgi:acyl transferase domain-containing protein
LISSFGAGGSNVHAVVEEHVEAERQRPGAGASEPAIILLSAKGDVPLREKARELCQLIQDGRLRDRDLHDVAFTLQVGREHMARRLGFVSDSILTAQASLQAFLNGTSEAPGAHKLWHGALEDPPSGSASDLDIERTIEACVTGRRYDTLVELWTRGAQIDWTRLHAGRARRRVSLPTYPFARERYWIPTQDGSGPSRRDDQPLPMTRGSRPRIVLTPTSAFDAKASVQLEPSVSREADATAPGSQRGAQAPAVREGDDERAMPIEQLERTLATSLAQALYLDPGEIGVHVSFTDLGLDSVVGVQWVQAINKRYDLNIAATRVYDHPNIRDFAAFVRSEMAAATRSGAETPPPDASVDDLLRLVQCGDLDPDAACRLLARHGSFASRAL